MRPVNCSLVQVELRSIVFCVRRNCGVVTSATGTLILDGSVTLRDLETQMQWSLPREGGVETLAGFVLMRLGHIPKESESVEFEGRRLTVVEMDARRIARIRVEHVEEE